MVENDKGVCVHRNECACYDKYGKKYEPGFSIVDEENCREW
uniref:Uncharacterized protein n=1 Tax=Plectus sambesii TaxID=2011161 RepID=A0A914VKJ4_9BILA